jgi:hypothetical protein
MKLRSLVRLTAMPEMIYSLQSQALYMILDGFVPRACGTPYSRFTMSNSNLRSRGAIAPGFVNLARPDEGWAERREAPGCGGIRLDVQSTPGRLRSALRPIVRRKTRVNALTPRDARLSALHRGDFWPGAALPSAAFPPQPCSELLAARSYCLAGGAPDLPGQRLRAAAAGRHTCSANGTVSGDALR